MIRCKVFQSVKSAIACAQQSQKLRERKVVWNDDDGKLDYDCALDDLVRDARVILSREWRQAILTSTPGSEK